MKLSATIIFKSTEQPKEFQLIPHGDKKPWRFLADNCAVELVPVCDSEARLISEPPSSCERFEIWPVQWGYPDSLVSEHPKEVEQMHQEHLAGRHDMIDGNYTWKRWLESYGKADLWHSFRTPDMERLWLTWQTGPGSTLSAFAGLAGRIKRAACGSIRFRAEFHSGDECQAIFLSGCNCTSLTHMEISNQPEHIAQQRKLVEQQEVVEANSAQNIANEKKLLSKKMKLEMVTAQNREEEHRARREHAQQTVNRPQVREALKVKTDRGVRKICTRHNVEWPQSQGELDQLKTNHLRHKKNLGEKRAKQNKVSAEKRREGF